MPSLYERLGESDGINKIANDLVDLHMSNPIIADRMNSVGQREQEEVLFVLYSMKGDVVGV